MAFLRILFALSVCSIQMITASTISKNGNFSCYQCETTSLDDKCGPETLKPCRQTADRCVTHITKSPSTSLLVKRECGLGPCSFESENSEATAVLGMDEEHCNLNRPDIFCILCCRGSGCNTATMTSAASVSLLLLVSYTLILSGLR